MTQPTDIRRDGERPLLLDLFSCADGAAMGCARAGFRVHGCDIADRPNYPFRQHRGDALEHLARLTTSGDIERYTFVHASPPCQAKNTFMDSGMAASYQRTCCERLCCVRCGRGRRHHLPQPLPCGFRSSAQARSSEDQAVDA
jgi:hypothetical protein